MSDLASWLLEQIAEDERFSQPNDHGCCDDLSGRHLSHERLVAECDAKRRIIELHREIETPPFDGYCAICQDPGGVGLESTVVRYPCLTLSLLALPYADREGFDPTWRP